MSSHTGLSLLFSLVCPYTDRGTYTISDTIFDCSYYDRLTWPISNNWQRIPWCVIWFNKYTKGMRFKHSIQSNRSRCKMFIFFSSILQLSWWITCVCCYVQVLSLNLWPQTYDLRSVIRQTTPWWTVNESCVPHPLGLLICLLIVYFRTEVL